MDRDLCVIDGLVSSWVAIDGAGVHGGGQELFITSTRYRLAAKKCPFDCFFFKYSKIPVPFSAFSPAETDLPG